MAHKAIVIRLYPTRDQERVLHTYIRGARFVWNEFLGLHQLVYGFQKQYPSKMKVPLGYNWYTKWLSAFVRNRHPWLQSIPVDVLRRSLENLDRAYKGFFKGRFKYPKFKSKRKAKLSFSFSGGLKSVAGHLVIPGMTKSPIKAVWHREAGDIVRVTVTLKPSGKWVASVTYKYESMPVIPALVPLIAYDLNLAHVVDSKGRKHRQPRSLQKSLHQLKLLQRGLSRKVHGSGSYRERQRRIARLHERITGARHFHHAQFAHQMTRENQTIILDGLSVTNLIRNPKLSRSIADASWGALETKVIQKARERGRTLLVCDRFFPSSQLCRCGYQYKALTLAERAWTCPTCHILNDRDTNAAENKIRLAQGHLDWSRRWGAPRTLREDGGLGEPVSALALELSPVTAEGAIMPCSRLIPAYVGY